MDRRRLVGVMLVAASACGYGSGALFAKSVYGSGLDWLALLFWRFLIGGLLLWALVLLVGNYRAGLRRLRPRRFLTILGLGAFFVSNAGTYYGGLQWISASLAALIIYIYPALVAVLSFRWGHGLQGRRPWAALAIVSVGVALTIGGIETRAEPIGIVLMVASPCCYAVFIILSARFAGERKGATADERIGGSDEIPPIVVAAVMMVATFGVTAILAVAAGEPVLPWRVPPEAWYGLTGIAVASTAVAVSCFYAGAARIGAASAALVSTFEPVWTISLAVLLYSESLSPVQLVGGAIVLAGVLLAQTTPGTMIAVREEP